MIGGVELACMLGKVNTGRYWVSRQDTGRVCRSQVITGAGVELPRRSGDKIGRNRNDPSPYATRFYIRVAPHEAEGHSSRPEYMLY